MRILVVEDEQDMADAVAKALRGQGYATDVALDGEEALQLATVNDYDLIVLDLNLPKIDGVEVCRRLRAEGSPVGILMLTARVTVDDRIKGLDEGADDYLIKPFHIGELLSRVRAILRRESQQRHAILTVSNLMLDPNTQQATFRKNELGLTIKEFALLEYLMRNQGRVISQEEILEHVWDEQADSFTQAVKVHVNNIRKKLTAVGGTDLIVTVKRKGYMI